LLGLAVVLAVLLELGLEPFAVSSGYWEWKPTKLPVTWYSAPIVNFFSWGITVLIALAFATPFFINKSPRPATRPDAVPLLLWLGTVVLLGASALKNGAAAAAAVEFGAAAVVTVLGIYAAAQKDTK